MKKTVRKAFFIWEYEEEEKWLNKKSKDGWHLVNASIFKYQFESGTPGEYTYSLELLDKNLKTMESTSYLNFLQEAGVEMVGKCKNWIYLRCKTADGGFDPGNRAINRITHLLKIQDFLNKFRNNLVILIALSLFALIIFENAEPSRVVDFIRGFCTGIGLSASFISVVFIPHYKKINNKVKSAVKELYTCE